MGHLIMLPSTDICIGHLTIVHSAHAQSSLSWEFVHHLCHLQLIIPYKVTINETFINICTSFLPWSLRKTNRTISLVQMMAVCHKNKSLPCSSPHSCNEISSVFLRKYFLKSWSRKPPPWSAIDGWQTDMDIFFCIQYSEVSWWYPVFIQRSACVLANTEQGRPSLAIRTKTGHKYINKTNTWVE